MADEHEFGFDGQQREETVSNVSSLKRTNTACEHIL
jgi:hypothetical protein